MLMQKIGAASLLVFVMQWQGANAASDFQETWQPSLVLAIPFNDGAAPASPLRFSARLDLSLDARQSLLGARVSSVPLQSPGYFSLDLSSWDSARLSWMGQPLHQYGIALQQTDLDPTIATAPKEKGFWAKYWWAVAGAAGIVVATEVDLFSVERNETNGNTNSNNEDTDDGEGGILCTNGECVIPCC